jgi:hypothetical protein
MSKKMNNSQWGARAYKTVFYGFPMECHEKVEAPFSILFNDSSIDINFYTSNLGPASERADFEY